MIEVCEQKADADRVPLTDAESAAELERAEYVIRRWVPLLGLDRWCLSLYPHREVDTDANCGALVNHQWQYLNAAITLFLPTLRQLSVYEHEQTIVHELCHIMLGEIGIDHKRKPNEERAVTEMAIAFMRTYNQIPSEIGY